MAQWADLPFEIQNSIFDHLFHISRLNKQDNGQPVIQPLERARLHPCRRYAHTCKAWQIILEPRIFRNLFITPSNFGLLMILSPRQKSFVRYIWLAIELSSDNTASYDALYCEALHGSRVRYCLSSLFYLVGNPGRTGGGNFNDLTLELSIFSRHDMNRAFRNDLYFDSCPFTPPGELELNRPNLSDKCRGWRDGKRIYPHTLSSILAMTKPLNNIYCYPTLVSVPAVTQLIFRRQTRRRLPVPVIRAMVEKLPNLKSMLFETWKTKAWLPAPCRYAIDQRYTDLILDRLPDTIKSFTFFEDFNEDYSQIYLTDPRSDQMWTMPPEPGRTTSCAVAAALARKSTGFEKLAASYLVEARDFFVNATMTDSTWPVLSSVFLTSQQLQPDKCSSISNAIFTLAGKTALRMPALQTMVIWYGAKGVAGEFRYERQAERASVGWRGTFSCPLSPATLQAWQEVASHNGAQLTVREDDALVPVEEVYSHGAAMSILNLGGYVVHPVSLEQIRCETSRYYYK